MTSPLKKTRDKKRAMLLDFMETSIKILLYPKGCLDQIDFRLLKKLSNNLNELYYKAKPYEKEI